MLSREIGENRECLTCLCSVASFRFRVGAYIGYSTTGFILASRTPGGKLSNPGGHLLGVWGTEVPQWGPGAMPR